MSVAPCSHCGGSGYLPTGKYCSCTNAKLEKALKNSERRAKEATAKKEKEKREKQTAMEFAEDQKPKKGEPPFQEGEWVEVFGLYSDFGKGITFIVDENNTKYEYSRILAYSDDEGDDRVGKYKVNWSKQAALNTMHDLYAKCSETIREMSEEYAEMVKNAEHHKHQATHWKSCHDDVYEENERLERENAELRDQKKINENQAEYWQEQYHEQDSNKIIAELNEKLRKSEHYNDMFNQPFIPTPTIKPGSLHVPNDAQVERLVPFSELERERLNFELLEKAVLASGDLNFKNAKEASRWIFHTYHALRQEGEGE